MTGIFVLWLRLKPAPDVAVVQLLHGHAEPVHDVLAAPRAAGPATPAAAAENVEQVRHAAAAAAAGPHALFDSILAVLRASGGRTCNAADKSGGRCSRGAQPPVACRLQTGASPAIQERTQDCFIKTPVRTISAGVAS